MSINSYLKDVKEQDVTRLQILEVTLLLEPTQHYIAVQTFD